MSMASSSASLATKPKKGNGRSKVDWFVSNPITNWFCYNKDAGSKQIDDKYLAESAFYEACYAKYNLKSCNVDLTDIKNNEAFKDVPMGLNKPVSLTYEMKYELGLLTSDEWKKHKNNTSSNSSNISNSKKTVIKKEPVKRLSSTGKLRKQTRGSTAAAATTKNQIPTRASLQGYFSYFDDSSSKSNTSVSSPPLIIATQTTPKPVTPNAATPNAKTVTPKAVTPKPINPPKLDTNTAAASNSASSAQKMPEKQTFMANFITKFVKTLKAEATTKQPPANPTEPSTSATKKTVSSDSQPQAIKPKPTIFSNNFFKPKTVVSGASAAAAATHEKVLDFLLPKPGQSDKDAAKSSAFTLKPLAAQTETTTQADLTDKCDDKFKSLYDQFRSLQTNVTNSGVKRKREMPPDAIQCENSSSSTSSLPSLSLDTDNEASLSPPPSKKRNFFGKEIEETSKTLTASLIEQSACSASNKMTPNAAADKTPVVKQKSCTSFSNTSDKENRSITTTQRDSMTNINNNNNNNNNNSNEDGTPLRAAKRPHSKILLGFLN
jgi:hypothetical protein